MRPQAARAPGRNATLLAVRMAFALIMISAAVAQGNPAWGAPRIGAIAAADSDTLMRFLGGLSDSTDRYFGISAAPPDTSGLDSALAYGLAHPERQARASAFQVGYPLPDLTFNRVDGPVWGAVAGMGRARLLGRLTARAGYAAGPNDWLGGAEYLKTLRQGGAVGGPVWALRIGGGRSTAVLDRDEPERFITSVRALVDGNDYRRYYRRDGWEVHLARESRRWRTEVGYRDMLERPLATTTTWNLAHQRPVVIDNFPAARGRAHEVELEGALRWPWLPLRTEVIHQTSGHAIGSDFEYRRTYAATSGEFAAGRFLSAVPQVAYGRVSATPVPQESFYLGGPRTLRSVPGFSRGGTGMALARLDLIEAPDLLELAHIPHPGAFPLQAGVFAALGAVWGQDPYGGPTIPGLDWPHKEDWLSEAGFSLLYQPGFPDPAGFLRLNMAFPLGPDRESTHVTIAYSRAFDLVRSFGD